MKKTAFPVLALCLAFASCKKAAPTVYAPISATITVNGGGSAYTTDSIHVMLINSGGTTVGEAYPTGNGTVDLGSRPTGSYTIRATARRITGYYVLGIYSTDTAHLAGFCTLTTPTQTGCDITLQ